MPTQTTQPWTPTVKPLKTGVSDLESLYKSGGLRSSYGPSRVAGLNSTLGDFWNATEKRARDGNPLLGQSQDYYSDVLSGKYLGRDAPGFSDVLAKTQDMVNANASAGSRYGTTTHGAEMTRELGGLQYQNYLRERGIMDNAAQMAPEMAAADYYDIDRLGEVGGARQNYDQLLAGEAADKFAFEQGADEDAILRYLQALSGVGGLGSINYGPGGGGGGQQANPWLTGAGIATELGSSYLGAGGTFGW
jgi:hypothetical protein